VRTGITEPKPDEEFRGHIPTLLSADFLPLFTHFRISPKVGPHLGVEEARSSAWYRDQPIFAETDGAERASTLLAGSAIGPRAFNGGELSDDAVSLQDIAVS